MTTSAMRIRRSRLSGHLSQTDMAARIGVTRSAVAQWEREAGTRPSVENLARIAVAAHVRFEWLATGRGAMKTGDSHSTSVPAPAETIHDELERRLLLAIRRLNRAKREAVVGMLESLTR